MRDYREETENRVRFIQRLLKDAHADGIVFGSSGGKDSALVGILAKKACANTVGLIMPCGSRRNYQEDSIDARQLARQYEIETREADLSPVQAALAQALAPNTALTDTARMNIPPRLRMTALYAVAASENRLVAGTGNRSERYMGYFTKWGDGAFDFNPIADLTVTEIYAFLRYLGAPASILDKAPSAGLFDGQTDETEMGISYQSIDHFLETGEASDADRAVLARYHERSAHKRKPPVSYGDTV